MIYGLIPQDKTWYYGIFCWYSSQRGLVFSLFSMPCIFLLIGEVGMIQLFTARSVLQFNLHVFDLFMGWSFNIMGFADIPLRDGVLIFFLLLISCVFLLIGEVRIMQSFTVWFVLRLNIHIFSLFIFWAKCILYLKESLSAVKLLLWFESNNLL